MGDVINICATPWPDAQIARAIRLWCEGLDVEDIAAQISGWQTGDDDDFGVSPTAIYQRMPAGPAGTKRRFGTNAPLTDADREAVVDMWQKEPRLSVAEIGRHMTPPRTGNAVQTYASRLACRRAISACAPSPRGASAPVCRAGKP